MRQKSNSAEVPLPPWEVRRKTEVPQRAPLTAERIVDAALAVVDTEGSAAVTMRRIASDLGVVASSLYAHVRNREELLLLVLERVMKEVGVPEVTGQWDADLKAHYTKMQRVLSAHGDVALYNFAAFPPTAIGVAITERLLSVLLNVGVPRRSRLGPCTGSPCTRRPTSTRAGAWRTRTWTTGSIPSATTSRPCPRTGSRPSSATWTSCWTPTATAGSNWAWTC